MKWTTYKASLHMKQLQIRVCSALFCWFGWCVVCVCESKHAAGKIRLSFPLKLMWRFEFSKPWWRIWVLIIRVRDLSSTSKQRWVSIVIKQNADENLTSTKSKRKNNTSNTNSTSNNGKHQHPWRRPHSTLWTERWGKGSGADGCISISSTYW